MSKNNKWVNILGNGCSTFISPQNGLIAIECLVCNHVIYCNISYNCVVAPLWRFSSHGVFDTFSPQLIFPLGLTRNAMAPSSRNDPLCPHLPLFSIPLFLSISSVSLGPLSLPVENTHLYIFTHTAASLYCTRFFPATRCYAFMRYRRFYFSAFFFFLLPLHWLPCGEDRGAILCRVTSAGCPPLFKIFIHKLPGAFYSTSNSSPTGEALSWRIQIGERGEKKGGATSEGLLNEIKLNIYVLIITLLMSLFCFFLEEIASTQVLRTVQVVLHLFFVEQLFIILEKVQRQGVTSPD